MIHTTMNRRNERAQPASQGVLPCPACRTPIQFQLTELITAKPIWCRGCGGRLTVNRSASESALSLWQRLEDRIGDLDAP